MVTGCQLRVRLRLGVSGWRSPDAIQGLAPTASSSRGRDRNTHRAERNGSVEPSRRALGEGGMAGGCQDSCRMVVNVQTGATSRMAGALFSTTVAGRFHDLAWRLHRSGWRRRAAS